MSANRRLGAHPRGKKCTQSSAMRSPHDSPRRMPAQTEREDVAKGGLEDAIPAKSMTMVTASKEDNSEGANHAVIIIAAATKLSGGTSGCWRAKSAASSKPQLERSTGSSPPETTRKPATRTGAHHDPALSGWLSRRTTTKGNSTTAEVLPKATPKPAANRRPPMLTPSPQPEQGACKAYAPLVTARPRVLPVGTTLPGAPHASRQPTEGPPALYNLSRNASGCVEVNTTS